MSTDEKSGAYRRIMKKAEELRVCACDTDSSSVWGHSRWCSLHPLGPVSPPSENEVRNFVESLRPRVTRMCVERGVRHHMLNRQYGEWSKNWNAIDAAFDWVEYVPA